MTDTDHNMTADDHNGSDIGEAVLPEKRAKLKQLPYWKNPLLSISQ